jgi:hypothetical protein
VWRLAELTDAEALRWRLIDEAPYRSSPAMHGRFQRLVKYVREQYRDAHEAD